MVSGTKKDVALGIVDFLTSSLKDGTVSGDDKESVEVAIDCISEVFGVDVKDKASVYGSQNLESLVARIKLTETAPSSSKEGGAPVAESSKSAGPTPEQKSEAEKFKIEGNRHMAQRNFSGAIESYTKAIELDGTNAIYLSNRSAAYSSLRDSDNAAKDAKAAIELDPKYSKAYSRLGLALYSMGDAEGAMKAYEDGLKAEGSNPSDGMKKGFETAKKRVQEDLETSLGQESNTDSSRSVDNSSPSSGAGAGTGAGGFADILSSMGGGSGGLGSMLQNPQIQQMASQLMSNPGAFGGMMESMMQDPSIRQMQEQMMGGQMPNFAEMMNNPAIQNLRNQFQGGNTNNGNSNSGSEGTNNDSN